MRKDVLKNLDLKVVAIISDLYTSRSVSATAANLSIRQSTVSMALARLRKHFEDPLFVRTSAGMEPTPRGAELIEVLKNAEFYLRKALEHRVAFDPANSDRVFRLSSTDIAQLTLLPTLLRRLKRISPFISVTLSTISDRTPALLESGDLDLAVGFVHPRGTGFYGQRLFRDRFICALRADHPRVVRTLTVDQMEKEQHVAVSTSGTGHSIVEETFAANGIRRQIGLRVPTFLGLGPIIANTDLLAILPEQLGTYLAQSGKIRLVPLPVDIPPYFIYQLWHERVMHDPASQWFRKVVAGLFLRTAAVEAPPESWRPGMTSQLASISSPNL
ncbi:MAG TPA: LysR family transcriptional regulator [Bryobacteraceae bacterium]|jgi:DNA-binding transcriptional LysR family regulator|nr:LysR family transcriptional regulator [Bryobacteraceae bacterium]